MKKIFASLIAVFLMAASQPLSAAAIDNQSFTLSEFDGLKITISEVDPISEEKNLCQEKAGAKTCFGSCTYFSSQDTGKSIYVFASGKGLLCVSVLNWNMQTFYYDLETKRERPIFRDITDLLIEHRRPNGEALFDRLYPGLFSQNSSPDHSKFFLNVDSEGGGNAICILDLGLLHKGASNYLTCPIVQNYFEEDNQKTDLWGVSASAKKWIDDETIQLSTIDMSDYFKILNDSSIRAEDFEKEEFIFDLRSSKILNPLAKNLDGLSVFPDLPYNDDRYWEAYNANMGGWLTGYPDGTVRLDNPVNRAELAKMAIKALGKEEVAPGTGQLFPDVPLDAWYAPTLYTTLKLGAITGYPDGTAKPGKIVNRAEALKIVLKLLSKDYSDTSQQYTDTSSDAWYGGYTAFSKSQEPELVLADSEGKLHPGREMTRGEAVELITRVLELR